MRFSRFFLITVTCFFSGIGSFSAFAGKKEVSTSADYKEARFLVNRDLPIQAVEIHKFVAFKVFQPPKEVCLPSTPDCWIVSFSVEGKDLDTNQVQVVDRILSAPLFSQKDAQNYVATLKNWEIYRKSNLKFDWLRVQYPDVASLFLIDASPMLSMNKFLQGYRLIYKFNLKLSHSFGAISHDEKLKPSLDFSHLCPVKDGKKECGLNMDILKTYGFFVVEPVFDFRVIANPKEDK